MCSLGNLNLNYLVTKWLKKHGPERNEPHEESIQRTLLSAGNVPVVRKKGLQNFGM